MTYVIVSVLAFALAATVLALGREMRLRKALEKLLTILLSRWRTRVSQTHFNETTPLDHPADPDHWL